MSLNVVSGYALQIGCQMAEKEKFQGEFIPREVRTEIGDLKILQWVC